MANLFLQNSLNNIFDTITETNTELPQWINIIDKKIINNDNKINNDNNKKGGSKSKSKKQSGGSLDSATSSAFMGQMGGASMDSATSSEFVGLHGGSKSRKQSGGSLDSATSSEFMGQMGGAFMNSATSSEFVSLSRKQRGGSLDSATSSAFMGQMGGASMDSATSSEFVGLHGGATSKITTNKQCGGSLESDTSSAFMGQLGGATMDSATSSEFVGLYGGAKSKNSSYVGHTGGSNKDINELISMLTSESNNKDLNAVSETTTETLEAQLRDILKQDGGTKKHKKNKIQSAGSNIQVEDIKNFFTNLKSQGVNVNVKLNDKTLSDFFELAQNTTTDVSELNVNMMGGAKNKKISKKNSKKSSKLIEGGTNAGFQAFLDFKKYVANKFKISAGPLATKIAGSVNTEMKKKHSDLSAVEIFKKNIEYFDKNIDKIKSEFKDLIDKSSK